MEVEVEVEWKRTLPCHLACISALFCTLTSYLLPLTSYSYSYSYSYSTPLLNCQAVENSSYRIHRLATVATQLAKWRCPINQGVVHS